MNTCISADSKGFRMHKNCASLTSVGERDGLRGEAKESATDMPRKHTSIEISVRQEESAKKKPARFTESAEEKS